MSTSAQSPPVSSQSLDNGQDVLKEQTNIYAAWPTKSLMRSYLVLGMSSFNLMTNHGDKLLSCSYKVLGQKATNFLVKSTFYGHFCGGESEDEVRKTVQKLTSKGYLPMLDLSVESEENSESSASKNDEGLRLSMSQLETIKNLESDGVSKISPIKLSSMCSTFLLAALTDSINGKCSMSDGHSNDLRKLEQRLNKIALKAKELGQSILVDAEFKCFQPAVDSITLKLMKLHNTERVVFYNTFQCYLKSTPKTLQMYIDAQKESDFFIGFKMVRGAYLDRDREHIFDTIEETHESYNSSAQRIVNMIAEGKKCGAFFGTHNVHSIKTIVKLFNSLDKENQKTVKKHIIFAQLNGMADTTSSEIFDGGFIPHKLLPYGPVQSVVPYLLRRAQENKCMLVRTAAERHAIAIELKQRMLPSFLRKLELPRPKNAQRCLFTRILRGIEEPNLIKTSKYTLLNFLFKCGYEQFQSMSNVYFLVIVVLAYLGDLTDLYDSPFSGAGTLIALAVVLIFSMTLEALYEIRRHAEDRKVNDRTCQVLRRGDGLIKTIRCSEIAPGDIIKVLDKEQIPSDCIFLASGGKETNRCYLETANIDGETNLKIKHVPKLLDDLNLGPENLSSLRGMIMSEPPSGLLTFTGKLTLTGPSTVVGSKKRQIPLTFANMLLKGCVLRNTKWVLALSIFTGSDTKVAQGGQMAVKKKSSLQKIVNDIVVGIFIFCLCICSFSVLMKHFYFEPDRIYWYLGKIDDRNEKSFGTLVGSFISFFILYSGLVPISLLVILTFSSFVQALLLHWDDDMTEKGSEFRSSCNSFELIQEIGQVQQVFSDKTGTLTRNEMVLVGLATKKAIHGVDLNVAEVSNQDPSFSVEQLIIDAKQRLQESNEASKELKDLLLSLSICHTVLAEEKNGAIEYNAEGPDEEAIINGSSKVGQYLLSTRDDQYVVKSECGDAQKFDVLAVNAFNSDRKRMSLLTTFEGKSGEKKYTLFLKGADNVVFDRLKPGFHNPQELEQVQHQLRVFSQQGLRTLVYARKDLGSQEAEMWLNSYRTAQSLVGKEREQALDQSASGIENDLEVIGVTAIEDRLQDGVKETITDLRHAGIGFWVLTGDKVETAVNICFSAGVIDAEMELIRLTSSSRELNLNTLLEVDENLTKRNLQAGSHLRKKGQKILKKLKKLNRKTLEAIHEVTGRFKRFGTSMISDGSVDQPPDVDNSGEKEKNKGDVDFIAENLALILTGDSLEELLKAQKGSELSESLLCRVCRKCSVVIACRVSPAQKALLVRMTMNESKAKQMTSLAIGDGANDVAMIKEASVGVGIFGHEGQQAANSADFKINQFRFLKPLLLKHGRYNYLRATVLILFVFYTQTLFTLTFLAYGFTNKFSGGSVYFVYLLTFYPYATNISIAILAVTNIDISQETLLAHPALYYTGRLNTKLGWKNIILAFLNAIFHALVLCVIHLVVFPPLEMDRATMSTALYLNCVLVSAMKCCLETTNWTFLNVFGIVFSISCVFFVEPLYYNNDQQINALFVGSALWDFSSAKVSYIWLTNFLATSICLTCEILFIYICKEFSPSLEDVVMEIDRGYGNAKQKKGFLVKLENAAKVISQPFKASKTAVVELLTALQDLNIRPARYTRNFVFDNPTDEMQPASFDALKGQSQHA